MTSAKPIDAGITSHAFFLADFAAVESGKAYVSGGFWDRMSVPELPASAFFSVVAVIDVPWSAYHAIHRFSIVVEDPDSAEMPARFDGEFQVNAAPYMRVGDPTIMPIAAVLNGMVFERTGEFTFVLRIDDLEIDRWPLRVVQGGDLPTELLPGSRPDAEDGDEPPRPLPL